MAICLRPCKYLRVLGRKANPDGHESSSTSIILKPPIVCVQQINHLKLTYSLSR